MVFAEITGQTNKNPKISMIGKKVQVLRKAPNKKFWIKTDEGKELVWHEIYLKPLTQQKAG